MWTRMDFDPAEEAESEPFGIDFYLDLGKFGASVEIASVVAADLSVQSGVDPDPTSHLIGSPYAIANPNTASPLVTLACQTLSGLLPGVQYALDIEILTTTGDRKSLFAYIPGESPENLAPPRGVS